MKDPRLYLAQIVERMNRIIDFTKSGRDAFLRDTMIQDAVIRNLEVISEAAKRIPEELGFRIRTFLGENSQD